MFSSLEKPKNVGAVSDDDEGSQYAAEEKL
jgi:hypothetical protein